jgi:hypothetical protein
MLEGPGQGVSGARGISGKDFQAGTSLKSILELLE